MRKMARVLIPLLVFVLLIPLAYAKEKKYRFELFGGGNLPVNKDFAVSYPQSVSPIKVTHEFSAGAQGGVRLGMDGHRYWGQDYSYTFSSNSSRIVTPYGRFSFTNRFHQASSNLLFYPWTLDRRQFFPYVTFGIGAIFAALPQRAISEALDPLQGGIGPIKSEVLFAWNAGAGVRIRLNERFSVRLDGRDYMSRALRYGLPKTSSDPNAAVLPASGVFHQLGLTFGLVIHF